MHQRKTALILEFQAVLHHWRHAEPPDRRVVLTAGKSDAFCRWSGAGE